jgi:competence protein ComEA
MKSWWKIPFGVVCGLLGAGIILLGTKQPRGEAIDLLPPPTPPPVVVHVSGAVNQPGVFSLPINSRVQDALNAAGGLAPEADVQTLNLAAFLVDGDLIWIPSKSFDQTQEQTLTEDQISKVPTPAQPAIQTESNLININTASQSKLEKLPRIGPVTAQKIIAYREAHGPFKQIENIQQVNGIGPATFEDIKGLITISDQP